MGNTKNKQYKVFLGGLNASGKTTILYKLKLGQVVDSIPTIGFNNQVINVCNMQMDVWDVGGGCMIRPLFKHYFEGILGLIYVIRIKEGGNTVDQSIKDLWDFHLKYIEIKIPILFFINKQQYSTQIDLKQIDNKIIFSFPGRKYKIQQCNGLTGEGLNQGMQWLANQMRGKNQHK